METFPEVLIKSRVQDRIYGAVGVADVHGDVRYLSHQFWNLK